MPSSDKDRPSGLRGLAHFDFPHDRLHRDPVDALRCRARYLDLEHPGNDHIRFNGRMVGTGWGRYPVSSVFRQDIRTSYLAWAIAGLKAPRGTTQLRNVCGDTECINAFHYEAAGDEGDHTQFERLMRLCQVAVRQHRLAAAADRSKRNGRNVTKLQPGLA